MCFTFKKNNKQTKKPVNCFLQDDASAGIQSLQISAKTYGTDYSLTAKQTIQSKGHFKREKEKIISKPKTKICLPL